LCLLIALEEEEECEVKNVGNESSKSRVCAEVAFPSFKVIAPSYWGGHHEVVAHSEFVAMCRFGGYTAIVAHPNEECAIYSRRSNLSKQNIHVVTLYVMDIKKYTVSNVKEHLNSMTIHQMMI